MSPEIDGAESISAMIRAGAAILSGSSSPGLDARVLAKHALDCDDAALIARANDPADYRIKATFCDLIMRRAVGEPIAYITGVREFWGMPFSVTRDVLIPRADSECLIEAACNGVNRTASLRILDLGTGSGCLLCALLTELPNASGVGVDQSAAAVELAQKNATALGLSARADLFVSDWFENVNGVFDIIIVNAPYIPTGQRSELMTDVSDFEPSAALFSGVDGLDAYRRIFDGVSAYLDESGCLVAEYGDNEQAEMLRALAAAAVPGAELSTIRDLAGRERALSVRRIG